MELMRYVDNLRQELVVAAEASDEETRELAERLIAPLSSAARLTLLDALSAAADEITRDLAPGSVEIRLRGLDPTFVVTPPSLDHAFDDESDDRRSRAGLPPSLPLLPKVPANGDEGATSRINFRPPEQLKARIEEAAERERLSVNAWLVRAASTMLEFEDRAHRSDQSVPRGTQRYTGWVN
ncbi:hypothetical protein [Streptomyces alboflavus]|uniref:hypothetical protein n=1 Tax=Streptomyces alboflavus TaxID=67267 RepID=UPI0004C0ADDC|nr:hypothetical protein [Streptomyces alboflavus]